MEKFDKNALLKAMKEYSYVSTQSGPVEPSKAKVIKLLKDKILKPVSKPQDGDDWDTREYKLNDDLSYGKNLITTKTLYKKVLNEAVSNKEYIGCRLNLQSIDMKETHCKFIIDRHGHEILVEMYFPNKNKNLTVKLESDNHLSNLYEVSLESEQFTKNFGYTILKTCDQLLESGSKYDLGADLDTMQFTNGMGTDVYDVNDSMLQQSNLLREAVSGDLAMLRNLCEAVNLQEAENAGQDPNAGAFSMAGGSGDDVIDEQTANQMMNPGDVNSTSDESNKLTYLPDYVQQNKKDISTLNADGSDPMGKDAGMDVLAKMVSAKMAEDLKDPESKGASLTADEILNGFAGINDSTCGSIWNLFFEQFDKLDTQVPTSAAQQFLDFLNNPGTDNLTLEKFERKLHDLFPEAYGEERGIDKALSTDNVDMQGEKKFDQPSGGDAGPVAVNDILSDTATPAPFLNDGSSASMVDKLNPDQSGETDSFLGDLSLPKDQDNDNKNEPALGNPEVSNEEEVAGSLGKI